MRNVAGYPQGKMTFKPMPIGAGGFVVQIGVANDNSLVCATDVGGSYVRPAGAAKWKPLFTSTVLPSADALAGLSNTPTWNDGDPGGYAIGIAPSDSTRIYFTWNSLLFKSTDQGATSTKLTGGPFLMNTNSGNERFWGQRLTVDPQNPNVFTCGTMNTTFVYCTDGSTLNTLTIPAGATYNGNPAPHLVACDPSSSVVGGIKQKWAYSVHGTGIYESTTGPGGTYTLLSGSPTSPQSMFYDAAGTLWVCNIGTAEPISGLASSQFTATLSGSALSIGGSVTGTALALGMGIYLAGVGYCGTLATGSGTSWTVTGSGSATSATGYANCGNIYKKTSGGSFAKVPTVPVPDEYVTIAVDPANTNSIVAMNGTSKPMRSIDGAASWVNSSVWNLSNNSDTVDIYLYSTAIAWMGKLRGAGTSTGRYAQFFPSQIIFSHTGGTCYAASGVGVWQSTPPTTFVNWLWTDYSLGIENSECGNVCVPPGGPAVVALHDWGVMPLLDEGRYINPHFVPGTSLANGQGFDDCSGWFIDYVPGTPTMLVAAIAFGNSVGDAHGYSTDGGRSWTKFAGNHPASPTIIVGGVMVAASTTNFLWFPGQNQRAVETTDGGATWAYISSFPAGTGGETGFGASQWDPQHGACSDKATGTVYCYNYGPTGQTSLNGIWSKPLGGAWTKVFSGNPGSAFGSGSAILKTPYGQSGHLFYSGGTYHPAPLYRSTNSGVAWSSANALLTSVIAFGFGKAAPGFTYPSVYVWGTYNGTKGLYVSYDNCVTFQLLAQYPGGYVADYIDIEGDMNTFGKLYLPTQHNNGLIGTYDFPLTVS